MTRDIKEFAHKILSTYAGNQQRQITALQILFDTTFDRVKGDVLTEASAEVCQHLHEGKPTQPMRCGDCVDIEILQLRADSRGTSPAPKAPADDDFAAEVLKMLGA